MATRMFSDEEQEGLRTFPAVGKVELIRYFTLTPADQGAVHRRPPVASWFGALELRRLISSRVHALRGRVVKLGQRLHAGSVVHWAESEGVPGLASRAVSGTLPPTLPLALPPLMPLQWVHAQDFR